MLAGKYNIKNTIKEKWGQAGRQVSRPGRFRCQLENELNDQTKMERCRKKARENLAMSVTASMRRLTEYCHQPLFACQ